MQFSSVQPLSRVRFFVTPSTLYTVNGILQARILEWVAFPFSRKVKVKVKVKSLSLVRLFVTLWTVAYQASLSMGFSRQEYQSGLPFPSPGDLPYPGTEPGSPALQEDALPSEPPGKLCNCVTTVVTMAAVNTH